MANTSQMKLFGASHDEGTRLHEGRAERWALWSVEGIGSVRLQRLISACQGDLGRLWCDRKEAARQTAKLGLSARTTALLDGVLDVSAKDLFSAECERLQANERLLHRQDASYPRALLDLRDPPEFVYIKGEGEIWPSPASPIALVGSRKVPAAHQRAARELSGAIARAHVTVVSGGALGMDAAAHRGALDVQGVTCAVLPGGLRQATPRSHRILFEEIAERGALLSEYPLDCVPRRYHYARRNRLIASLSRAVLVLKAAARGGTLLTVEAAEELGRGIMVLPYEASDEGARGSHALIRSGRAVMVCDAEEVLAQGLGVLPTLSGMRPVRESANLHEVARAQVDGLTWPSGERVCGVDELAHLWDVDASQAMVRLFELEICGAVRKVPGAARYERLA